MYKEFYNYALENNTPYVSDEFRNKTAALSTRTKTTTATTTTGDERPIFISMID
jgi:hypothetical protein